MKVTLYMAITANGYIAAEDDDTSWISSDEWSSYAAAVKKAKNLVIGRRTYEIITKQPEFSEIEDVAVAILSHTNVKTYKDNHTVVHSPAGALQLLKDYPEVIVAGGSEINSSFLSEGLIDEICLDVEPMILGRGIGIFKEIGTSVKLQLIGTKMLTENEIQLHYKVLK